MHAVEMILPKPGDYFWRNGQKVTKTKTVMHLKKDAIVLTGLFYIYKVLGASLLTQTENIC